MEKTLNEIIVHVSEQKPEKRLIIVLETFEKGQDFLSALLIKGAENKIPMNRVALSRLTMNDYDIIMAAPYSHFKVLEHGKFKTIWLCEKPKGIK